MNRHPADGTGIYTWDFPVTAGYGGNVTVDIMAKAFWILASLDAIALFTLLVLTVNAKGHNDGGREMALAFFIILPLIVLGITVATFALVSAPLVKWSCVAVAAVPLVFYANAIVDRIRRGIRNNPVNQYESEAMKKLTRAITRLDVEEVRRWAPQMDKKLDQGAANAPMRLTIDLMVKEMQTRLPAQTEPHLAILRILLANGAKPNEAMEVACWTKSGELFAALFKAGADPNFFGPYGGPAFFGCLSSGLTSGSVLPMVKEFVAAGVNVNGKSTSGFLPAAYAADCGQFDAALYLLDHGADPDARDDRGDSLRSMTAGKLAALGDRAPRELKALAARLAGNAGR